ncbi:MAG: glycine cleavage system protein GcvH [Spirochaetota bacterium]
MLIPEDLRYTVKHEWIRTEGGYGTIGITDYAQQMLGDIVFVELPEAGTMIRKGESFGVVESVKAASDVYAPVSGEVVEVNEGLAEHPEFVNQSPYDKGWMIRVRISNLAELDDMMDCREYENLVQKESEKH